MVFIYDFKYIKMSKKFNTGVRNINTVSKIPKLNPNPNPNLNQSIQVPSYNETRSLESCNQRVNNLFLNPENRLTVPNSLKRSYSDISSNQGINDQGHITKKPLDINTINDNTNNWIKEVKSDIPEDSNVPEEYQQEPARAPISLNETVEQLEVKLNEIKKEIYRLSDEVQINFEQVEEYVEANGDMMIRVVQRRPWNNRNISSEEVSPVSSVRSYNQSDNGNIASDNQSDNGNIALDNQSDNGNVATDNNNELLPDNASSKVSDLDNNEILSNASSRDSGYDQVQSFEPLDSGLPLNEVEYNEMFRFDNIIHNNYTIYMQGDDTIDYRMAYEYLIDSLNNLDILIQEHNNLLSVENNIIQRNVNLVMESEIISSNIDSLLNMLNAIN